MNYIIGYEIWSERSVMSCDGLFTTEKYTVELDDNFLPSYWRSLFRTYKQGKETVTIQPTFSRILDGSLYETSATHDIKLQYVDFDEFYTSALRESYSVPSDKDDYRYLLRLIWNEYRSCHQTSYIVLTLDLH